MPRLRRTIGLRVPDEVADAIEKVNNKSQYIMQVLLADLISKDSKLAKQLKKEEHIKNVTLIGQLSNSVRTYRSIEKGCTTRAQKNLLKREMISVFEQEKEMASSPEIKAFIDAHIKEFGKL